MTAMILCIEDEDDLRKDIVEELRDAGYETLEAENGKTGLDVILQHKPDLVISDITMPVMDGHALLEELRNNHPDKCDLPFLFLTALADRENIVKGKKLGADDYLTKPVDYEMLLAAVESRLEHVQRLNARRQQQLVKVYKATAEVAGTTSEEPPAKASVRAGRAGGAATPGTTAGGSDVEKRLREFVTSTPTTVVAGRVQLLGLDEFKEALGKRWERHGEIILNLIEQTLKKRLSPADVYQRDAKGNFTICFAELKASEAAFKARAIADEVRAKVMGKDFGQDAAPLTAEANAFLDEVIGQNGGQPALTFQGEAHEVELGGQEVAESSDLLGLLTSRLEAAAERAKKIEQSALVEIAEQSALQLYSILSQSGAATPFYFAAFDQNTQARIEALRNHRPASEDLIRDLDVMLLAMVAEEIFRRPPGKNIVLVVDIHFSTIDNKRRLEHLKTVCNTLTEPARASVIFNIVDIPPGLLPAKVAEHFFSVRHFCRAMMAQCRTAALGNIDPQMLRTPILSFKAGNLLSLAARDPGAVMAFIKQLRRQKLKLLVYSITSAREEAQMRRLGVDFLSSV